MTIFQPSDEDFDLRTISLGAGVQSTAVALLAARGIIGPMPDCAICRRPVLHRERQQARRGDAPAPVHARVQDRPPGARATEVAGIPEGGADRRQRDCRGVARHHSNDEWRHIRDTDPDGWERALTMDDLIRGGVRGTEQALYLHRDMVPLAEADLRTAEEMGQMSLWDDECEGMCGL